ncbi:MAG TPA: sulfotransferase [Longimicrobiaceae bacterium]|nr:sulfotransferase [Longimicrobiaceae bacterium]
MPRHLIHVGYPKAGSTFLQEWFRQHPDLCYAPGGLGGFPDVYSLCRLPEKPYRYYVTSFEGLSTPHRDAGRIRLDWSRSEPEFADPIKTDQAKVCDLLRTLYPDSRVLLVTRGFRDLMISGYSQYVRSGGVLHLEGMSRAFAEHARTDALHYYDFDYLIRLYTEAFGEESLIVLPYELLRDDRKGFLTVLEEALGLEHVELEIGRVNPSLSPEELYWYPVISRRVAAVAARLGADRFERLYRRYATIPFHNRLRPVIRLLARLKPDRKITESDFPEDVLRHCVGKATLLRHRPLYAPYAREYLWDDEPAGA